MFSRRCEREFNSIQLETSPGRALFETVRSDIKLGGVSEGITIIKQRLHRNKILLILDDVDKLEQLEALAGGLDWFGRGSRVIITTRDKHLLTCHGIESMHSVEGLYGTEALELLTWMAFKNNKVPSSYEDVLNRAVSYASGLPLVIDVKLGEMRDIKLRETKGLFESIPVFSSQIFIYKLVFKNYF
ncbi:putative P-loop containing nucleoside triphosphate hydrolase [Medicago truncatula]|uniref:Putative P-loop containing nucleoside triphosphate hydrolase n=1 Tax=Medicago truncatula TaxID=3880 RepID=A0A396JSM0_MEDTR|nr:putative P-loop containing nucleoside triphosphate hydrolase [Medicago truncatula]